MHPNVVAALECPHCRARMTLDARVLRCAAGHAFDVARSGYVNLVTGRPLRIGDTAEMVAARARVLDAGHFDPLSDALALAARDYVADRDAAMAVEIGAGTARHLARVVESSRGLCGLAIDASPHAAKRAARAHPRVASIVADVRATLPVAGGAAALVLVVFAPRNGPELRRLVADEGALVVATPTPRHLAELRAAFQLLEVDERKDERLEASLAEWFTRAASRQVDWELALAPDECAALVAMGPSAHHVPAEAVAQRARSLPPTSRVTGSCRVDVWRPRR